jgi:dGTPase
VRAQPKAIVGFSPAKDAEHHELKKFLRNKLYRHERMQATRTGAGRVLQELFDGFMGDTGLLPAEHRDAALAMERADGKGGRARAVADYIAGMTDRYAFQEHARITGRSAV